MTVKILDATIKNPIEKMGEYAGIAYDSDTTDSEKNYKRGKQCILDGHGRMLEFCDVFIKIDGYSCRVIREFARHVSDGLTMIQRSTRYCNESNSEYYIPLKIKNDEELSHLYNNAIGYSMATYESLVNDYGVKKEDAANLLPLGLDTVIVIKKNARALMDMAAQRLCSRAYIEYRTLMKEIINALSNYSEEWKELCEMIMKCKCDKVEWCEEHFSCGKYPKKDEVEVVRIDK